MSGPAFNTPRIAALAPGRAVVLAVLGATALLALALPAGGGLQPVARVCAWLWLMILPGAAVYALAGGDRAIHAALAAAVASPVLFTLVAVAGLLAGVPPSGIARILAVATVLAVAAALVRRARQEVPTRRETAALAALLALAVLITAYLPVTREFWRVRSDAWFHAAVVAQIRDFGLPAEDPYFVGMPLQYMWAYHAMVLTLADALRADVFWIMAIVNIQAVAGLGLSAWSLAGVFRPRVAHRAAATASLLFLFNAAFWLLLPIKAARALVGAVRGTEELMRTFSLTPFDYRTVTGFMTIYFNQDFFLDKYMVATAFGLALAFMTMGWFAAVDYLAGRRASSLLLLALALLGMLTFHSLVGFVMLAGIFGGAILTRVFARTVDGFPTRDVLRLLGVSLACFVVATPYLYQVMHMKEREQVIPISFSLEKAAGIVISSALVLFLALRGRVLFADRSPPARMFLYTSIAVAAFCLSIRLPGPNTYDKLGYFVFIPVSILGGFAIAESLLARRGRSRRLAAAAWLLLFFLPVNALPVTAAFLTPGQPAVSQAEAGLAAWVRRNTARDAVMIDDHERVFLLVDGPRRYYWGWWAYAQQWGYPRLEMARRYHVRRSLYGPEPLDAGVLEALGGVGAPLYVIARPEHRAAGACVVNSPGLFELVYDGGDIALYRVNAGACRAAAAVAGGGPSPEELIRESDL